VISQYFGEGLLVGPDAWMRAARHSLDALDRVTSGGDRRGRGGGTRQRADDLTLCGAELTFPHVR
jgi:hypothetical protein